MRKKINRRDFVLTSAAAAGLGASSSGFSTGHAPYMLTPSSVKPLVIVSDNGNVFKKGGNQTCVEKAFSMMVSGSDVLDALIAGVNILELDPEEYSVGYGGVPNSDGVVQLDSSCMHGPKKGPGQSPLWKASAPPHWWRRR